MPGKKRRVITAVSVMRELTKTRAELDIVKQSLAEANGTLGIILSLVRKRVAIDPRPVDPEAVRAALETPDGG